jgi:hypothetical protein
MSSILTRQLDHVSDQAFFVSSALRQPQLCGSMLAQNAANMSLRYLQLAAHMIDVGASTQQYVSLSLFLAGSSAR